jgi:hypothetical protein
VNEVSATRDLASRDVRTFFLMQIPHRIRLLDDKWMRAEGEQRKSNQEIDLVWVGGVKKNKHKINNKMHLPAAHSLF